MKQRLLAVIMVLFLVLQVLITPAFALTGFEVISGDVTLQQSGNTFNITSNSSSAIVQWQSFNVNSGQTVNFLLPTNTSSLLNRIMGGNASNILGNINSNGTVLLSNTAGINIGATANINTGGFIASTLNLSNSNYLNDNWVFTRPDGVNSAGIINEGNISTSTGGFVVLAGGAVMNTGNIFAPEGTVHLAVGDEIRIALGENTVVDVVVNQSLKNKVDSYQSAISNLGRIDARTVILQADLLESFYAQVVNNDGVIYAVSAQALESGFIRLSGASGDGLAVVKNSGELNANGNEMNPNAGRIEMSGDLVAQEGLLTANAGEGGEGGNVFVSSTKQTVLSSGSVTSTNGGTGTGQAGETVIWSDEDTYFESGAIVDVSGGDASGDGGFVEVSGYETVYFKGQAYGGSVDGQAGSILIDPLNIVIDNVGVDAVAGGDNPGGIDETFAEDGGATLTFDPQAGGSFIGFGDIHLQATNDITVNSAFDTSIATGNASVSLTLEANNDININAPLTTNNANISLLADADTSGVGNLNINGAVNSNGGDITLSAYDVLVNQSINAGSGSISSSGDGDIFSTAVGTGNLTAQSINIGIDGEINLSGSMTTTGGDITLTANTGGIFNPALGPDDVILNSTASIDSNGGNITLDTFDIHTSNGSTIRSGAGNVTGRSTGDNIILRGSVESTSGDLYFEALSGVNHIFIGPTANLTTAGGDVTLITNGATITNRALEMLGTINASSGNITLTNLINTGDLFLGGDLTAASLQISSGRDVIVQGITNITNATTTLTADENIIINSSLSTNNHLTMLADNDNSGAGYFANSTGSVSSNGGNITIQGRNNLGTAAAVRAGDLDSGGGSITITGTNTGVYAGNTPDASAIVITTGDVVNSGGGAISLVGTSGEQVGVYIVSGGQVLSNGGDITINGTGGVVDVPANAWERGVDIEGGATTLVDSGGGNVSITGTGFAGGIRHYSQARILTQGGNFTAFSPSADISLSANLKTEGGDITVTSNVAPVYMSYDTGASYLRSDIGTGGGDFTINSDDSRLTGVGNLGPTIDLGNTGTMTFNPITSTVDIGISGGAGALNLTDAELDLIQNGTVAFGGASHTGDINVGALDVSGQNLSVGLYSQGNIVDTNGAASNIITDNNLSMYVSGVIGTDVNPLEVTVGNTLTAQAFGQVNGVSLNVSGTVGAIKIPAIYSQKQVSPYDLLSFYSQYDLKTNPLPGLALLNGRVILSPAINQTTPSLDFLSKSNFASETRNAINPDYFIHSQTNTLQVIPSVSPDNLVNTPALPVNSKDIQKAKRLIKKNGRLQLGLAE